ncbi:MAG: hypothetical protein J2P41_04765 [Blastocatellia bacterium]|nr:hypothetical protein [Blastocatellia bacterium]
MSRSSRIVVCKEGPQEHELSNDFPTSGLWVFCCNCQTFIAWESGRPGVSVKECPSCQSSLNPRLYTCDHCSVTMLDFDDQALRKQHTVLLWGMPQPACPGCHQFPGSTPKVHYCQSLEINLATARSKCLFCGIELDDEAVVYGVKKITAKLDAALADAEAKARQAEERMRLAEETAQKEIKLRVQAERKAQEIELVALELIVPQVEKLNHGNVERKVRGSDERARAAPPKAPQPPPASSITKKDKVLIVIYTFFATILTLALVGLIYWMVRLTK